jgi:hypothetical protein
LSKARRVIFARAAAPVRGPISGAAAGTLCGGFPRSACTLQSRTLPFNNPRASDPPPPNFPESPVFLGNKAEGNDAAINRRGCL